MKTTIVWIRSELRLHDHPALHGAAAEGAVVPLYVWSPREEGAWAPGAASRWWIHRSLEALARSLEGRGSRLVLRSGDTSEEVLEVARAARADAVVWTRRHEPAARDVERRVAEAVRRAGLEARAFEGCLLADPERVLTRSGEPYKVFTPFWRALSSLEDPPPPLPAPGSLRAPSRWPASLELDALSLLPRVRWDEKLEQHHVPGEARAREDLAQFLEGPAAVYDEERDRCDLPATSGLSPRLHHGELSVREAWHASRRADERIAAEGGPTQALEAWRRQLAWREFGHMLLHHFPALPEAPFRPEFVDFPWREDEDALRRWRQGETGYPLVDAGMRELWESGVMHNRVRLVVASFLTKHLLIPWQQGARWFWDTLVDADLANNTLGWQWTAGCGPDAAPYFRVFNPTRQSERFDPRGAYVARHLPALASLPPKLRIEPAAAPPLALAEAGLHLGRDYPRPMIEHSEGRRRALAAWESFRAG